MSSYEQTMLKLEKMASANTATQMNWQERMSNTSHQREVKDLVAAGLNPVLSSGGSGAQSYTTSVDSAVNGIANMASARESASATRFAASQSAAATRYAAQMNYAAAAYAANMNYKTNQYTVDNKPQAAIVQAIKKVGQSIDPNGDIGRKLSTLGRQFGNLLQGNEAGMMAKSGDVADIRNYSDLSAFGENKVVTVLGRLGLSKTMYCKQLAVDWLFHGDYAAARKLYYLASYHSEEDIKKLRSYFQSK